MPVLKQHMLVMHNHKEYGRRIPPLALGPAGCSTTYLDTESVSAHDRASAPCSHGCGALVFQESPVVVGDQLHIRSDRIVRTIKLLAWQSRPMSHVVETLSSSWTGICWRTKDDSQASQNLTSSWTGQYAESGYWGHRASFKYPPLHPSTDAIRLLHIHPSAANGRVNATLSVATLSRKPFFYALSYEWGPAEGLRMILLNGKPFQIRNNLFDFLNVFSRRGGTSTLWIDAICINQEDIQEKTRQVALMGDIYRTATCVHLWLGNEADGSGELFEHFHAEGRCIREFSQQHCKVVESPPMLDPIPQDFPEHKVSLARLLHRSYWTRAWIVQELVLARDITVHCGSKTISWSYLRALALGPWSEYFEGSVIEKIFEHRMVTAAPLKRQWPLLNLLALYPDQQCQEPRDRIYSLLSLDGTIKSGKSLIEVDYEIDLCSLLLRTFNASQAGFDTRDAGNFERLRLALSLEWEEVLDSTTKPRYVKEGESWYSADRPFDVFAQVGVSGTVTSAEEVTAGPYAGMLFITLHPTTNFESPFLEGGLTSQAEVGDYIFELFGTSLALVFRIVDDVLTFVAPIIVLTVWQSAHKLEDIHISHFEHQLLVSSIFQGDDPAVGWSNFVRLNLVQWAAACGCLKENKRIGARLPQTAGSVPDVLWRKFDPSLSLE